MNIKTNLNIKIGSLFLVKALFKLKRKKACKTI